MSISVHNICCLAFSGKYSMHFHDKLYRNQRGMGQQGHRLMSITRKVLRVGQERKHFVFYSDQTFRILDPPSQSRHHLPATQERDMQFCWLKSVNWHNYTIVLIKIILKHHNTTFLLNLIISMICIINKMTTARKPLCRTEKT